MRWASPFVQGSVTSCTIYSGIHGLDLVLWSRRSCRRSGTRYNHRGLDDEGSVANFNESEFIVSPIRTDPRSGSVVNRGSGLAGGGTASFVQIRGSVPLFWNQTVTALPINPPPQLVRELDLTWSAFTQHQSELDQIYGDVTYVDLLTHGKGGEQKLGSALSRMIKEYNNVRCSKQSGNTATRHYRWDFHHQVKQQGFEPAMHNFVQSLRSEINRYSHFAVAGSAGGVISKQKGVFRTNCLDCLDRTNAAQWFICWNWLSSYLAQRGLRSLLQEAYKVMEVALEDTTLQGMAFVSELNIDAVLQSGRAVVSKSYGGDVAGGMTTVYRLFGQTGGYNNVAATTVPPQQMGGEDLGAFTPNVLKEAVSIMWADHGDHISKAYTGTGSVLSSLLRQGRATLSTNMNHVWTSIGRVYQNAFEDPGRQDSLDLFLLQHSASNMKFGHEAANQNNSSAYGNRVVDDALAHTNLKIWVGTWNLCGRRPCEPLERWLFPTTTDLPQCDIYVIAFQELVELTGLRVLINAGDRDKESRLLLNMTHSLGPQYVLLSSHSLVGLYLLVFVKASLTNVVTQVQTSEVKLGFKGQMGNKGALLVRFLIGATSFCLGNVHLVSGGDKASQRQSQLEQILNSNFPGRPNYSVRQHDVVVLAGDFNFRCATDPSDADMLINFGMWNDLLITDQYCKGRADNVPVFLDLQEGQITFQPTYKFRRGSPLLDKSRLPAWCDRIFYTGAYSREQGKADWLFSEHYGRIDEFLSSDHKPVYGVVRTRVLLPKRLVPKGYEIITTEDLHEALITQTPETGLWEQTAATVTNI